MGATWRDATEADAAEIHRLVRELARYENLLDEMRAAPESFRDALAQGRVRAMLAEPETGRAVAVCVFYPTFSTFAGRPGMWIEDIFVDPAHRRQGLARAAFRRVAAIALDEGCAWVEWNVLAWNALALHAYTAMGAETRAEWRDMRVSGAALLALADRKEAA